MLSISSLGLAQKNDESFANQNKNTHYKSFSGGMGISYTNNTELLSFIGYEIPNFYSIFQSQQKYNFSSGIEFFGSAEYQVAKLFSTEIDYNYFTKSIKYDAFPEYDFSYSDNRIFLTGYYLVPDQHAYLKFGAGVGVIFSDFTYKYYGLVRDYTSTGFGIKLDAVLNFQLSKNVASYFGVYGIKTFSSSIKDATGNILKNNGVSEVNLSSLGVGLRLGLQLILF